MNCKKLGKSRGFTQSTFLNKENYYQLLELPSGATLKDIKVQFKKMSKKYHPDLNSHLPEDEQEKKKNRFMEIIAAYETLKDAKAKRQYDLDLRRSGAKADPGGQNQDWRRNYYGEAKYFSRAGGSPGHASRMNSKRHSVHLHGPDNMSTFSGMHRNYGDRFAVPHFNYQEHLSKHLKFEQRLINKTLSKEEREQIMQQLTKSGNIKDLDEELITKHLMRQAQGAHRSGFAKANSPVSMKEDNRIMYESPNEGNLSGARMTVLFLGAGSSLYLLYHTFLS